MTLCVCIGLCVSNVYNIWISTYNANVNIVYISTVHSVQQYKHNLISCSPTHSLTHEFIHLFPAQNSLYVRKSARLIHPFIHFLFLSKLSAWRVLDRGFKTHSGLQVSKKQNVFSLTNIQYCVEPPWPRGSVLSLRPTRLEFRIMCLEGSVISFLSPSSTDSHGPV